MTGLNTSYARKYVVVSKSATTAVLRVVDDALYHTYWKEFISAEVSPEPVPGKDPMFLRIEQAPPEIVLVDQFSNLVPELPLIHLTVGEKRFNITEKVAVNIPNTEVPGLFRLDYRVNFTADFPSVFWNSYVSIQQRPLLRKAAAGWTRDSYITRTLNRLVMEPQFMEAMHAAGEPLYGFMQANQHPSIRASLLSRYANAQAWGVGNSAGQKADPTIFITGPKLPQGSVVIYQGRMLQLREPVFPDVRGSASGMDHKTHSRVPRQYKIGSVFRYGNESYVCIAASGADISVNDTDHWRRGNLYRFAALGEDAPVIPQGLLPIGKGGVEHIWVTVDNQGYPFWVDITHETEIGAYRGHYNRKDFADYNSGDIVSYVEENSIRLFIRKRTDIQDEATLIYPPGHYLNPAWEEIYFHMPDGHSPLLSEYSVVPHTNAANAVIAKTWSVSEEMCRAYSHMVGIPESILNECGAKWSALLFALLTRTRNTFDGLRLCMRAVGLDVTNLTLSEPSVSYYANEGGGEALIEDVYAQHEILRGLAGNIETLEPFGARGREEDGALRYDPEDPSGNSIQQYMGGAWVTRYRFAEAEPSQNLNNRYYDGDIDVLARLAEDAVKDLGDGKQWVKSPAWAGKYSALVGDVISYEIPIYVWVRLHMHLYDESRIGMETSVYSGVLDGQRCGARTVLELFPSRHLGIGIHDFVEIPTGVFAPDGNGGWEEVAPTRIDPEKGSKIYEFDQVQYPIRIRALDPDSAAFIKYWQSTHTFGLLGLAESESTDSFINVTDPAVTDESDLMLANGYVGVTALYRPKGLQVAAVSALRWMYILGDDESEEGWGLSEDIPFADWGEASGRAIFPFEGTVSELKDALSAVGEMQGGRPISFRWDGDALVLKGAIPGVASFRNASGKIIGVLGIFPGPYTLSPEDIAKYPLKESVRITFTYG